MKRVIILIIFIVALVTANDVIGQDKYPTHWFTGMKEPRLQIMLHGKSIGNATSVKTNYPGVSIKRVSCPENKNYLFIDLEISSNTKHSFGFISNPDIGIS